MVTKTRPATRAEIERTFVHSLAEQDHDAIDAMASVYGIANPEWPSYETVDEYVAHAAGFAMAMRYYGAIADAVSVPFTEGLELARGEHG